jgi:hypothetical protein
MMCFIALNDYMYMINLAEFNDRSKILFSEASGAVPCDGVPFVVVGTYVRSCPFGADKHKRDKQRAVEQRETELKVGFSK